MGRVATHYTPDPQNPFAAGYCDGCGQIWQRSKIERQMEYRGLSIQWTGFWHCPNCLDVPNAQNQTPYLTADPLPIQFPLPEIGGFAPDTVEGVAADDTASGEQAVEGTPADDTVNGDRIITSEI